MSNSINATVQILTDKDGIADYLLLAYLEACEEQNNGIIERTIGAVSGEICDLLAVRFELPFSSVPSIIRNIASVFAAYRIVQAITSLVSTEATTDNEWIPLQKQWANCNKLLQDVVNGKIKLGAKEKETIFDREEPSFQVVSGNKTFNLSRF